MFGVFTQFLPIYLLVLFSTQCGKSSRFFNFMKKNYTLFVYLPKYSLVPNVMYEKEKFLISLLGSAEEEELGIARVLFRYKILLLIT